MFLFERLIGVGVYCLALLVFCMLVGYSKIKIRTILIVYVAVLTLMAYFYYPYKSADLYRIFEYLKIFGRYNFKDFFNTYVITSSAPAGRLLYWLIAKTGMPHLLPALVVVVCYGLIFYILNDSAKRFQVNRSTVALVLFFYMSIGHYMGAVSNIRTMLAVSMIAFCFYTEEKKKRTNVLNIFLYIIAIAMHNLAIVFVLIRIVAIFFSWKLSLWQHIVGIVSLVIVVVIMQFVLPSFTGSLVDKTMDYMSNDSHIDYWELAMDILTVLALIYFMYIYSKVKEKHPNSLAVQNSALRLAVILSISFIWVFTFFHRIVIYIAAALCIPFLMELLSYGYALRYSRNIGFPLKGVTCTISFIELGLSCTRGSLSGLKFFELGM